MKMNEIKLISVITIAILFIGSLSILANNSLVYTLDEPLGSYEEPVELAEKVEMGELPSVKERLPVNPPVVKPMEEIGEYGGSLDMRWASPADGIAIWRGFWDGLFFVTKDREIVPNIAKGYEYNEDKTAVTIYLREGVKWSDGEPFTTDDMLFWWEDYTLYTPGDEEPELSSWMTPGGEVMEVEKIDDYTIKFEFAKTHPMFMTQLAVQCSRHLMFEAPAHYLKQFHPKYNESSDLTVEEQYSEFLDQIEEYYFDNSDCPTLKAWKISEKSPGQQYVYERNPFYWKVDPEGKQLPYLDKLIFHEISDDEVFHVKASQGVFDIITGGINTDQLPMLYERREKSNYEVGILPQTQSNVLYFNWDTPNKKLKELFQNVKFRRAISIGLDREYIWDMGYNQIGTPGRCFITPENPLCVGEIAEWREKYAEFDPEKANQMLDELGLEDTDDDGIREYPDGEEVSITFDHLNDFRVYAGEFTTRAIERDLGIKTYLNVMERGAYLTKIMGSGEHEATVCSWDTAIYPLVRGTIFFTGTGWVWPDGDLTLRGKEGYSEPPELFLELQDLWSKAYWEAETTEEREKYIKEALKIHSEQIPVIGVVANPGRVGIKRNDLHNYPFEEYVGSPQLGWQGVIRHEQLYTTRE